MATILIIDDEVHIARVLALWLKKHGHDVLEATNGLQALEIFQRQPVDLIISDMNMPQLDGLGMLKRLREECHSDVPVLLLSARCDQCNLTEQLRPYRAQLYPKPFVPSRLVADIERLLASAVGAKPGD